jgi:type IV secretion system protein VirD4
MARAGDFLNQFLFHVILLFNRITSFFQQSQDLHTARFAHLHELSPLLTDRFDERTSDVQTSLLLGISSFNQVLSVRPTKTRRELGNLLVVAPPRSGKSVLATAQLLSWHHSVVVNDVKGELFAATAGYRSKIGKVFVIDPTGVGHRYDPTVGKHTDLELKAIAKGLLYKPDEGEGEIFTQRGTRMLTPIFHAAVLERIPLLPYVAQLMNEPIQAVAARLNALDPSLATRFLDARYEEANFSDRFLLSSWSTLTARLDALLSETVVQCFTGSDFAPQDLLLAPEPITVYLRWKEQDLLVLSPLVWLLWTSLINELTTNYDLRAGQGCHPVLLLIDEAGRTAIPSLADHATTVIGRGLSLWLSIQSLSQLDAVYGTARAQIIKDDMDCQLFYKPADQKTAEYIERALGDKSGFAHSETKHETHSSEGTSEQRRPVLTAWEIKHLTKRTEIFGFYNSDEELPPFRAKRMDWRPFPVLVERQRISPPELSPLPTLNLQLPLLGQAVPAFPNGFIDPDALIDPDSVQ